MRLCNNHSVVHSLQGSTLHGIKLHKKLWKCSQRRLEGDNLEGGVLFNKFKVLVSCTQMCHDPVSHTDNQMLSPVPIAPQNIQKMRDWVQTFGVAVRQMAKAGTLLLYLNQREIGLGEPVSFKLSHFEEQRKKKKKKKKPDPSSDKESDETFPDDETACDDSHSIFGMRDSFYPQKIFPTSENHCLLQ